MGQNIRRDARAEIDELDLYGCFVRGNRYG